MQEDIKINSNEKENPVEEKESQATVLISLEGLIKRHISSIERIQEELKKNKEMFDGAFEGSEVFRELLEKLKEANKQKTTTREQILKQPAMMQLAENIKGMRQELKELRLALSDYLQEFQRLSGLKEIEDESGQLREIINTSKVVRKSSREKSS